MESVKLPNNNNFDTNGSSESEQISGDGENEKLLDYSTVNDETVATMSNDEKNGNYEKIDYSDKSRSASPRPGRRSDEPVELSFEKHQENREEREKRRKIEAALANSESTLQEWREFALSEYGLINDDLRREVWPRLAGVDRDNIEPAPKLDELKSHPEYNQVILDVNRSLKRFPPGIPYEQRIALQDQLTVLILRVIIKYPHLRYYQGYHDVAVTFLLVVGEEIAFHVMEILSTNHLAECMQMTMEPIQKRLMYLFPIIRHESPELCTFLESSTVGTLFALPWYLTWFGHSLNSYRAVVRLYDYFLASPFLLPLYVTAAIVLYRADDIFKEDCDMASIHCLLSQLPDDLPFEYLLKNASDLYRKYPPSKIEIEVDEMILHEKQQRAIAEEQAALRRKTALSRRNPTPSFVNKFIPQAILSKRSVIVTTAFSILVGICAYYYKTHFLSVGIR